MSEPLLRNFAVEPVPPLSGPVQTFVLETLPLLARHYRREALNDIESRSEWLKTFTSREPDFDAARNRFFKDGSGCTLDLENHIELTRLARANEALTRFHGSFYSLFLAEVHRSVFGSSFDSSKYPSVEQVFGKDAEIEEMCNRMIEVEHVEHPGTTDFLRSFLDAGQATIISDRKNVKTFK